MSGEVRYSGIQGNGDWCRHMPKPTKYSCLIVFATAAAMTSPISAAEFRLRDEVRTSKNLVLLGDIADIYAANPDEANKLAAVEMTPTPVPGGKTTLKIHDVQDLLSFRGIDPTQHRFSGAARVTILRTGDAPAKAGARRAVRVNVKYAQRAAADAIVRYLRENVADEGWQVTVDLNEEQAQAIMATSDSPSASGGEKPWIGAQQFDLVVGTTDRSGDVRLTVNAQVALPPSVAVAIHAVPKGAVIRSSDIELQRVQPGKTVGNAFTTFEEVVGKEAVKAIAPGQTLDANYVRPQVLVHGGEVITVYGRNAGIVVRMPARARDSGAQGELVTVESLLDRKAFLARVCGLQEVEVYGGAATTSPSTLTAEREDRTKRSE